MAHVRVKICGICRAEDAVAAARAGADFVGMVFVPGASRCLSMDTARQIVCALPSNVAPVALFVDAETDVIRRTLAELNIRRVQLHGHEPAEQVAELGDFAVFKAFRVIPGTLVDDLRRLWEDVERLKLANLHGLVLETGGAKQAGGTGIANDWDAIEAAQQAGAFEGLPPIIAAGGLHPGNVAAVVRRIHPWAVDVSSGVERVLREKSVEKIQAFVQAAWGAE